MTDEDEYEEEFRIQQEMEAEHLAEHFGEGMDEDEERGPPEASHPRPRTRAWARGRTRRRNDVATAAAAAGSPEVNLDTSSCGGSEGGANEGSGSNASASPTTVSAADGAAESQGALEVPGFKRQRVAADAPDPNAVATEAPISRVCRMPVLLHNYMPTSEGWDDRRCSFQRLMSARMVKDALYSVSLENFWSGDPQTSEQDDGLASWLLLKLRDLLLPKAPDCPAEIGCVCAALSPVPHEREGCSVLELQMHVPFLRKVESVSLAAHASAPVSQQGVDVDGNYVRLDDGRCFRQQSQGELCTGATLRVAIAVPAKNAPLVLEVRARGGVVLIAPGDGRRSLDVPPDECERLLLPSEWRLAAVADARKRFGHPTRALDASINPIRLAMLAAALSADRDVARWTFLLQLAASGMYASSKTKTSNGKDFLALYVCDEETGCWAEDHASLAFEGLLRRVQRDVCNLHHDMARAVRTLEEGLEVGYFRRVEVANMVSDEAWDEDELTSEEAANKPKEATIDALRGVLRRMRPTDVQNRLRWILQRVSPEFGQWSANPGLMRNEFVKTVVVEGGEIHLDERNTINFSDGWCWDADIVAFRRIRPSDFSSLTTTYKKPELDEEGRKIVLNFLAEVHPDPEVLAWRLGLKARCLVASQQNPVLLSSQGVGGGCKSMEATLTRDAFGPHYAVSLKAQALLGAKGDSADSASPSMCSLRNKRYVSSDECGDLSSDLVKTLLGGDPMTARMLHGNPQTFALKFPVLEILSNRSDNPEDRQRFKTDAGMRRRVRGCYFDTAFEEAANALEARNMINKRAALPPGSEGLLDCEQQELQMRIPADQQAAPPPVATSARAGYEHDDVAYFDSFHGYMFAEKYSKILSLAPQLMLYLTELHVQSQTNGWGPKPDCVDEWTAEIMVRAGSDNNQFQEWMKETYKRCGCIVGSDVHDPSAPTTEELYVPALEQRDGKTVQVATEKKCTHCVAMSDLIKKMRRKIVYGSTNMFAAECGNGTKKQKTSQLTEKLKAVRCFPSVANTNPPQNSTEPNPPLQLLCSEPGVKVDKKLNVIRGIELITETEADAAVSAERQAAMDAQEAAQFPP